MLWNTVLLALRAELRERGFFAERAEPNFADLLDLVALGTVADVVKLDRNNRILVSQGLKRMRAGRMQTAIEAAYELCHDEPVSALRYAEDIDKSNLFVVGAATKGLQAPGIRIGWVVASKANIEILGNFSSFGMGGVSHPSQRYALELLAPDRVAQARTAVPAFYRRQRDRYGRCGARSLRRYWESRN